MIGDNQKQQSGDNSVNVQGKSVTINNGLSYSDVKEIVLDTFHANFLQLSNDAANLAKQRAEELTNDYLKMLKEKDESALDAMNDPDMQYTFYTAQREYARSGNKDLSEMLVDILFERSRIKEKPLMQIVLNECVEIAPKLTSSQLDILSLVFIFKYTQNYSVNNFETLKLYIESRVLPFTSKLKKEISHYQHLEYAGCGSISIGERSLPDILLITYAGLFCKGFNENILQERFPKEIPYHVFKPCLHNDNLLQINAMNEEALKNNYTDGFDEETTIKLQNMFTEFQMTAEEVKAFMIGLTPDIKSLFEYWEDSSMKNMTLTSVGIALAHANIRRKNIEGYDLSIWIN
ncbi:LPO_1073/Vpar_1526 family protein [Bacillus sp. SJS]|uniref:LPO_1073/Vpar_1526 family protein n=1 Tax=Bacillus sp. SJS TaxID=1423321 RepID=UPI0004DCB6F5|nr:LPO_1073/Vpar_1526 family protein [Bacillus sp. SJS]KZZ86238.1 hypothetical protein AS29_001290 [Bacillus sp. SJS]